MFKKKITLVNREVNPYAKVATLSQTFLPTFGIRLKSDQGVHAFSLIFGQYQRSKKKYCILIFFYTPCFRFPQSTQKLKTFMTCLITLVTKKHTLKR